MNGLQTSQEQSRSCAEQAASRHCRRREGDDIQRRADRAQALVQLGELSAGRHALESIAPWSQATFVLLPPPPPPSPIPREPRPYDLFERRGLCSSWITTYSRRTFVCPDEAPLQAHLA